jgi:hypothetical protein
MTKRSRIVWFGSAGLLVIAGGVCAAVIGGETGQVLALALIGIGLVEVTSLVFLEIGLGEDRERARERATSSTPPRRSSGRGDRPGRSDRPRRPDRPRLERMRGRSRRLK